MTVNYEIGKPRADKKRRITLLLCIGKTKKRIKTDILVSSSDLTRKGKVRNDCPAYKRIYDKVRKVEKEYTNLDTFLTGEHLSASQAVERMRHTDIPTFFTYAERWLSRATMKGVKNYRTALNNFRTFTKGDIPFSLFSRILINDYLYSLTDRPRAQSLYLNAIKKIYTDAEKDYELKAFSSFRIEMPRQQKARNKALDADTIRKIFAYQGKTKRSILAHDCAMLSFFLCGTNSADLYTAPPIRNNTLSYDRQKTKDRRQDNAHIEIEIPRQIRPLVRKYKDTTHAFCFHTLYPDFQAFNKYLNIGLKTIQRDLGMENLTFYAFRHSWATIARNDLGIEKWTVHEALCHVDSDTSIDDVYIRKDYKQINVANKLVADYVLGKDEKN